jgi:hypothetical protein
MEGLFDYLATQKGLAREKLAETMLADYQSGGRHDKPLFLRPHLPENAVSRRMQSRSNLPRRQQRHLAGRLGNSRG